MDPVKLNHYRLAAENGYWKHKRTAFQESTIATITRRYCDNLIRIHLAIGIVSLMAIVSQNKRRP